MDKLDRYAKRFADEVQYSDRSHYYRFGDWILRVSDHIATTSSFTFSVLTPTVHSCGMYILHNKSNNTVIAVEYEEIKHLIHSLRLLAGCRLTEAKLKREKIRAEKTLLDKYRRKCKNQKTVIANLNKTLQKLKKTAKWQNGSKFVTPK